MRCAFLTAPDTIMELPKHLFNLQQQPRGMPHGIHTVDCWKPKTIKKCQLKTL